MSTAIPPLPNTPSWRSAQLSKGATLPYVVIVRDSRNVEIVFAPKQETLKTYDPPNCKKYYSLILKVFKEAVSVVKVIWLRRV
jgi:hypothetical protein